MVQPQGEACGPVCLSISSCSSVSCGLPVPGKGFVRRTSLYFLKKKTKNPTAAKDNPQSSHSQIKREGSKTFATKQEDQAVVLAQGSQGGRRRGLV